MDIEKERGFSIDYLNECFDFVDGVLIWEERPVEHFHSERYWKVFMARFSGKPAGRINQGYLMTPELSRCAAAHTTCQARTKRSRLE